MNAPDGPVWFVGDLDDPWVGAVADAVPGCVLRQSCAGELSEGLFRNLPPPRVLVLHRAVLSPRDAERLARLRGGPPPAPGSSCALARTCGTPIWNAGRRWWM